MRRWWLIVAVPAYVLLMLTMVGGRLPHFLAAFYGATIFSVVAFYSGVSLVSWRMVLALFVLSMVELFAIAWFSSSISNLSLQAIVFPFYCLWNAIPCAALYLLGRWLRPKMVPSSNVILADGTWDSKDTPAPPSQN